MTAAQEPVGPSGWDRRRERVALEIEDAALYLFAARGFDAVTVSDIARAVGISDRTYFRYFATKEDVLLALPRRISLATHDALARQPADMPLLEALRTAFAESSRTENRARFLRWASVADEHANRLIANTIDLGSAYRDFLAARLGSPADGVEVRVLSGVLAALVAVAFSMWIERGGRDSLVDYLNEAISSLVELARLADDAAPARARKARRSK